jgi:hypothetical protein
MESKYDISKIIPDNVQPATFYIPENINSQDLQKIIYSNNLTYPLYVKPDIGGKGKGVKKVNTIDDILKHIEIIKTNYILQTCIELPNEAGIFYVRLPNEKKGKITGINFKVNLQVTGNGTSTMYALIRKNKRAILQLTEIENTFTNEQLHTIIEKDKTVELIPYGNHSRGAMFLDYSNKINDELEKIFNSIASQIPGFYFGRCDVKFNTWEELNVGKNISIIELNGAGSEPTHIYDPSHSIFFAWKEIIKHLNYLYKISKQNKNRGFKYGTFTEGRAMLKKEKSYNQLFIK